MINLNVSTMIYRPVKQVFDFVSTPENDFQWQYGILATSRLSEDVGKIGSFFRSIGHLLGRRVQGTFEVTEYETNSKYGFQLLSAILSDPGEPLPQERRTQLLMFLKDGCTQSLCRIISGLHSYRKIRPLNDSDQSILKQARNALLGEWGFVLSLAPAQAEHELHHWLASEPANIND